jgi:hypothetical protein
MPNSDTQYGIHNKLTKEYRFYDADGVITQSFAGNVETAKAHFLTADALTNNDTNGTQLEYAITADGNGLKMTIAFGTKGTAGIAEADDWAGIWTTTKDALAAANNLFKTVSYTKEEVGTFLQEPRATDGDSHLF